MRTSQPPPVAAGRAAALPDLGALDTFVAVCEAGSMAAAASRLGLSPSAVSQIIGALERGFGQPLFDRDSRPAKYNAAGRALLERARPLLAQARALPDQMRGRGLPAHPRLRLGCVDSFAATVGPALVHALSGSAHELQLWSGLTPGLGEQLQARELDLAILTEAKPRSSRLARRLLFSECWVAVFPRKAGEPPRRRPLAFDELRRLQALPDALPLIRYSQRSLIGQQVERLLVHGGLQLPRRYEFDATDPLLSLVAAGLGWAISTPLCLWQSRAWLEAVHTVPLPATQLGPREFFLLSHEGEWAGLAEEVVRVTRSVLQRKTLPALRRLMPALGRDAITVPSVG